MTDNVHTFNSEQLFQDAVITSIRSRLMKKQTEGGVFRMALSGGSTPGPIYSELAQSPDIDWSKVEVSLVDERYVPLSDERSNTSLIQETFLELIEGKRPRFITFDTSVDIEDALNKYEEQLEPTEDKFFDLVLLGMGTDGHTASLFPNDRLLKEGKRWVGHTDNGDPVPDRLTLTYPALKSSREIFFLIKGKNKKDMLEKVCAKQVSHQKFPAAKMAQLDQTQIFFADI